jgi:CheY-like chemotaxis protein
MPRILAVDDDPDVVRLLRLLLTCKGYDFVPAANGDQALQALGRQPVDLVLLDVMMPVRDGLATLAAIRSSPPTRGLPVLMLTASGNEEHVRRAYELGANAFIAKPFAPSELCSTISAWLAPPVPAPMVRSPVCVL